jgi:hypothetical protein
VSLQLRIAHPPARQSWKLIGDSVPLSVSGTFSVSASVQAGESTVVIRVVLMRGHRVVEAGRADVVSMSAISVRGSKASPPPTTTTTPTVVQPVATTPLPPSPALPSLPSLPPPSPGSTLYAGEQLDPGQELLSSNGAYELIMQSEGDLVLYHEGDALWSSGIQGAGAYAVMQSDGNLVIYDGGEAKWSSNTAGFSGAYLQVQNDSNVVVYQSGHPIWDWMSGYIGNELNGWTLNPGSYLLSPNHEYELIMQSTDGNLVLYQGSKALWSSGAEGAGSSVTMQTDGNLVIYNGGVAKWNSNTDGFPGGYLQLQDDSNAVIYQSGHPVWDWMSGYLGNELNQWTLQPGAYLLSPDHEYQLIMQGEGNLVLYHEGKALWDSSTWGNPGAYAVMQADGNFVVYSSSTALWSSGTAGYPGAYIVLQDDSNLVIYQGGTAIWDWASGRLGGTGPTPTETAAINWAIGQLDSSAWDERCLEFVQDTYEDGAGIDLEDLTSGVAYNDDTDPEDVWGHTTSGTTGIGTPPYGALVFFNAKSGYNPEYYSHVTIMGSDGEMISTPDAFDDSAVHYETLDQAEHSGAYATYVGWWLPDG